MYLDVGWMCGGVAHSFCTAVKRLPEPKKHRQDCLMSSAQSFHGPCLPSVAHSVTCGIFGYVPLLHMSTQHLASYSGLLAPAFVVCSTNAGEGLVKLSHVV